jgi:hypothetical protein
MFWNDKKSTTYNKGRIINTRSMCFPRGGKKVSVVYQGPSTTLLINEARIAEPGEHNFGAKQILNVNVTKFIQ